MKSIISTSLLMFREAIRSGLVASLTLIILSIVLGLPLAVNNDSGTVTHNTIYFPLILAYIFLIISALWISAFALSSETKSRTLQLARVKPIRMWKLWFGKWLGLSAVFAFLLAVALSSIAFQVRSDSEYAFAYEKIPPLLPSVEDQIASVISDAKQRGITDQKLLDELRAQAVKQMPFASISLSPGKSWNFNFINPHRSASSSRRSVLESHSENNTVAEKNTYELSDLKLLLKLETTSHSAELPVISTLLTGTPSSGSAKIPISQPHNSTVSMREMTLPFIVSNDTQVMIPENLAVAIAHIGTESSGPLLLQPRQGIFLLKKSATLAENFFLAYLVMLSVLTLLIALGLTLGALFSMPVAVFCATCIIITVFVTNYTSNDPDALTPSEMADKPLITTITESLTISSTRFVQNLAQSVTSPSPVASLAANEKIKTKEVSNSVIFNMIIIPALLMLFSSYSISRKELAE